MAEEMMGRLSEIVRVKRERISTPLGITKEWPGRSRTSSKVRASGKVCLVMTGQLRAVQPQKAK
jgi:hypothetical protein